MKPSRTPHAPLVLVVVAAALASPLAPRAGRSPGPTVFPVAKLREDFALLRSAVTEAHAGLFVYKSPPAVVRIFDSAVAALHDTTEIGFYGAVAGVLAQIRDGHTRSLPSEEWMAWYTDSARVLPLHVRLAGDRAWVTGSTDPRVQSGTEILAIDGRKMGEIAADIRRRLPADGYIETGTLAQLNTQFAFWYYLFESQTDSFRLDTRGQGSDTITLRLGAVPPSALPPDTAAQSAPLSLSFLADSSIALLRIRTFAADEITEAGLDYTRFLDAAFHRVREARSADLILDLRGNDGGRDTYGSKLLSHLVRRPFAYYRSLEARTDRVTFWRHTNVDSTFNTRFSRGLIRTSTGTFQFPRSRHQNLGIQQPRAPFFAGPVWVLIDGGTFSTASEFCAIARSLGRATFIGQETGGTYQGNTSGTFVILTLPHTRVRVVVPLVRYSLAVKPPPSPGRGVLPDHVIEAAGVERDTDVLDRAVRLVRQARSR